MQSRRTNESGQENDLPTRPNQARRATGSARRWDIRAQQAAAGVRPCFASQLRFTCTEVDYPWREECRGLRAGWQR